MRGCGRNLKISPAAPCCRRLSRVTGIVRFKALEQGDPEETAEVSSILEALKKAEAEAPRRERVRIRSGRLALDVPRRPERRLRLRWLLLAGGITAAAAAAWLLKPDRPASTTANIQSYRITPPKNTTPRKVPGQTRYQPAAQTPRTSSHDSMPAQNAAARQPVRGQVRQPPSPQRRVAPAAVQRTKTPRNLPDSGPATRTASRKTASRKSAAPRTPVYQRSDHGLTLQAIAWDPDARKRFAVINNQIVRQGQRVDGKLVERIAEDELIVAQGGKRWKIEFRIE